MNSCIFDENSIYTALPELCQYRVLPLKILLTIKTECVDFDKKRATKNASPLKTNTKNVLCEEI